MAAENYAHKIIAQNKKARHDYFVLDSYEAGIELLGTEVKSLRAGAVNLKDSYCYIEKGELFMTGVHISPYEKGNIFNRDPVRDRKLLMHKKEINWYMEKVKQGGYTVIPTRIYFSNGKAKVEIALGKGKKLYDKRESIKKRDDMRNIDKEIKDRNNR